VNLRLDGSINLSARKINLDFTETFEKIKPMPKEKIIIDKSFKPSQNSRRWAWNNLPLPQ